jgi:hypothetical protein
MRPDYPRTCINVPRALLASRVYRRRSRTGLETLVWLPSASVDRTRTVSRELARNPRRRRAGIRSVTRISPLRRESDRSASVTSPTRAATATPRSAADNVTTTDRASLQTCRTTSRPRAFASVRGTDVTHLGAVVSAAPGAGGGGAPGGGGGGAGGRTIAAGVPAGVTNVVVTFSQADTTSS